MSILNWRSTPLVELLAMLKKDELTAIRQALGVKGVSQLNKIDLAKRLAVEVIDNLEHNLRRMDTERFRVLQSVMNAPKGVMSIKKMNDNYDTIYFLQYGLLFPLDSHVVMPREVMKGLQELDLSSLKDTFRRNEQWIKLTQGLLFYYGYMEAERMLDLIEEYTGEPVDFMAFFDVVHDLQDYDYSLKYDGTGIWHYMVGDPEELVAEQQSRSNVSYYPVSKEDALRASAYDYLERHAGCKAVVAVLRKHWSMTAKEADQFAEHMTFAIQNGASVNDLLTELQEQLEFGTMNQVHELMDALVLFNNCTRRWVLKGQTPLEVSGSDKREPSLQPGHPGPVATFVAPLAAAASKLGADVYSFETKQKIGRNEPCPCGSGKKYKKCCGSSA